MKSMLLGYKNKNGAIVNNHNACRS